MGDGLRLRQVLRNLPEGGAVLTVELPLHRDACSGGPPIQDAA